MTLKHGRATYLKARDTNKCGNKVQGPQQGWGLGAVPPVGSRNKAPSHGVRGEKS